MPSNKRTTALAMHNNVLERIVNELYNAGLNIYKTAKLLNVEPSVVRDCLPKEKQDNPWPKPAIDEDNPLIQKILYDFDMPVATDVLIENEKARYAEYSRLEKTSLRIMNSLLEFYSKDYPTGDLKEDKEIARMAAEFIRVTQSARQELIQKYSIDKQTEQTQTINIEFI